MKKQLLTSENVPLNRTLEIARLLWENTDADHGLTLKEIQGDVAAGADGAQINRYIPGNLGERGLDADRKTVSLAIAQLAQAGLAVEKVRNGNRHEYRLARHAFTSHELDLLFAAVQSSNALTEHTAAQLGAHMRSLASKHEQKRLKTRTLVAGHVRRQSDSAFEKLDPIYQAIDQNSQLFFKYYEYDAAKKRVPRTPFEHTVSPVLVAYSDGFYYLIAHNDAPGRDGLRTYRIDHMSAIRALEVPATSTDKTRALKADPQAHLNRLFGMFAGEAVNVTLRVKTSLMRAVIDRFGMDVKSYPDKTDPDRFARVFVNVSLSPTFFSWVLQFNGDIIVESPTRARQTMRDFLTQNAQAYN